jgi:hypothetical protein
MPILEEFLRTGQLGPIRSGMSSDEVETALGSPQDESTKRKPRIVRYGPLQIAFVRGEDRVARVSMVALYPRDFDEELPTAVRFDTAPLESKERVHTFLTSIGITPTAVETEPVDQVVLPSDVRIVFDEGAVHGVYFSPPVPAATSKQLTLTLPAKTLDALKALAKTRKKRSVAELAASVLTAHITAETH